MVMLTCRILHRSRLGMISAFAVGGERSFTKAAARLRMSQSLWKLSINWRSVVGWLRLSRR